MEVSLLNELLSFLQDPKQEVRQQAVEHVLGLTTDPSALAWFRHPDSKTIVQLQALCHDHVSIAHAAFKSLINIASDPQACAPELIQPEFVQTLTRMILHPDFMLADLACMLQSQLTRMPECIRVMLMESHRGDLDGLVEVFCKAEGYHPQAHFHFLASVFANLSMTMAGRLYFLQASERLKGEEERRGRPLQRLVLFTQHENIIRRGGVLSTIKNCCMALDEHRMLLEEPQLNLLVHLLLPLAGPEDLTEEEMEGMPEELHFLEPTKQRESDPQLRRTLLESLLVLACTRFGRNVMRKRRAYPILRHLHLNETDEACDLLETELVQLLMREEKEKEEEEKEEEEEEKEKEKLKLIVEEKEEEIEELSGIVLNPLL